MSDSNGSSRDIDAQGDTTETVETQAVTSNWKILGQLSTDNGVGVLGQNDASSGTPIGVQGAVPNNTAGGYGLHTPHNARIEQTAELGALGGPILGGAIVNDLVGPGLAIASNKLRIGSGAITTGMLGPNGASAGQTFVWDGSQWTTSEVSGTSKWADSDSNSLLEPSGSATGIDVTDVQTDTLADDGAGAVTLGAPVDLNGNDLEDSGTTIWDTSNGYLPQSSLQNSSVTIAGNTVSLGGSTGISHGDLSGVSSGDHHARPTAGYGLTDTSNTFDVSPGDFAGTYLTVDGSGNLVLATPYADLADLFGSPVQTSAPISPVTADDPLLLKAYDGTYRYRALALGPPGADIPNESRGIEAPNIVAGHPDNNTGGASPRGATIVGGGDNGNAHQVTGDYATVCGGNGNTASDASATVAGGENNTASGFRSFAAGNAAAAENSEAFVWNDGWPHHSIPNYSNDGLSSSTAINSEPVTGRDTFTVGALGGARFVTGTSSVTYIEGGTAGWTASSSKTVKTNIEPIDSERILEGVREMEVATWEYEGENGEAEGTRQIGPMAEDFHDVVEVGGSDEHINSVDADGVAFAAIQGLADKVEEKDERIEELEADRDELREENEELRDRLTALEDQVAGLASAAGASPAEADD